MSVCSYPSIIQPAALQSVCVNGQTFLLGSKMRINDEYYLLHYNQSELDFPGNPEDYLNRIHYLLCKVGSLKRVHLSWDYYAVFNSKENKAYLKLKNPNLPYHIDFSTLKGAQFNQNEGTLLNPSDIEAMFNSCE